MGFELLDKIKTNAKSNQTEKAVFEIFDSLF